MEKDGIILLNKKKGITSFKAINELKLNIHANKVGHAGTLDPMAEGLMLVMINSATKFSDKFMKKDKEYYVEMELGYETDTYDSDGQKTKVYEGTIKYDKDNIIETINSFIGTQYQVPPIYSAIKVNGKKMYEMAREGKDVERKPREIVIKSISNIDFNDNIIMFNVEVSSGTYIRSLIRDIGERLNFGATMTKLVRTKIDDYLLDDAFTIEEINEKENKNDILIDIETLFNYENIMLAKDELDSLSNGMTVLIDFARLDVDLLGYIEKNNNSTNNKKLKVYTGDKEFIGIVSIIKLDRGKIFLKRDKYFKYYVMR